MATITLTIPAGDVADLQEALCDIAKKTPVNAANAKAELIVWLKALTKAYRKRRDDAAALAAVTPPVDPDLT